MKLNRLPTLIFIAMLLGVLVGSAAHHLSPDAATAIVALIESRPPAERFDMIVMGGQPHRVFAQLLSGTPHEQVARRSHLPVMVVQ